MDFRFRYVPYGTNFTQAPGPRTAVLESGDPGQLEDDAQRLHANELALDVGGACWGHQDQPSEQRVLDHHFYRAAGQFPSAAAAVLHNAERIRTHFDQQHDVVWLVTHREPDFDAYAAMYLARGVIQGCDPASAWHIPAEGWQQLGLNPHGWYPNGHEIDWYAPAIAGLAAERRWPILLASVAAHVDNCRRMACPKHRTLDAILYAALVRGRDYRSTGAAEFFDAAREILSRDDQVLNPLCDAVFEHNARFAPELALLDGELSAYGRDLERAKRTVVYVQQAARPFDKWFPQIARQPLVDADLRLNPAHLRPNGEACAQVDGLFLRNPECLLFKSWARSDTAHAPLGHGFVFTGIAYSGGRPGALENTTDYYFSLNPEYAQADGLNLYNVWALLQHEELLVLARSDRDTVAQLRGQLVQPTRDGQPAENRCRRGFEDRAASFRPLLDDPWFDGGNYACTIVPTPNRGTLIGKAGTRSDLSDDPIARLVESELERAALPRRVSMVCYSMSDSPKEVKTFDDMRRAMQEAKHAPRESYCFCSTELVDSIDPTRGGAAEQIARQLWRLLDAEHGDGVPTDFLDRHMLCNAHSVHVWNRRGIATAVKASARETQDELASRFEELIELARRVEKIRPAAAVPARHEGAQTDPATSLATADSAAHGAHQAHLQRAVDHGAELLHEVVQYRRYLARSDARLLRRFFEASGLEQYLRQFYELQVNHSNQLIIRRLDENVHAVAHVQHAVEWLEVFIISYYAMEMVHTLHIEPAGRGIPIPLIVGGIAAVVMMWGLGLLQQLVSFAGEGARQLISVGSALGKFVVAKPRAHNAGDVMEGQDNRRLAVALLIVCLVVVLCSRWGRPASNGENPTGAGVAPAAVGQATVGASSAGSGLQK